MKDVTVPTSICPGCGDRLDCASPAFGNDTPAPGDVTVCLRCGHMMAFSKNLRLRELTKAERRKADNDARIRFIEVKRREVMQRAKH